MQKRFCGFFALFNCYLNRTFGFFQKGLGFLSGCVGLDYKVSNFLLEFF